MVVESELVNVCLEYEEDKLKNEINEKNIWEVDDEFKWCKNEILWLEDLIFDIEKERNILKKDL